MFFFPAPLLRDGPPRSSLTLLKPIGMFLHVVLFSLVFNGLTVFSTVNLREAKTACSGFSVWYLGV